MKERREWRMPDMSNVVSATECTGIMAAMPKNEEEYEAEQELYGMEIPRKDN